MTHSDRKTAAATPLFANPNFVLLWLAYGISAFGDHLSEMALLKLQHAMDSAVTDTTRRSATMLFVFMSPFVMFGPLFGWLADRLPRKWIMIVCCAARAAILVNLLPILNRIMHWWQPGLTPNDPMPVAVAVAPLAAVGLFAALFSPARLSLIPTIVDRDQLIRANASTAGLGMIASILSYFVGPILVNQYGVHRNFLVNALTFLSGALFITMIRPTQSHRSGQSDHGPGAVVAAFRYVATHRRAREVILISTVFWAAASVVRSIIPAIVKQVFAGDYQDIGKFQGLMGVGLLGGSIVLTLLGSSLKSELAASWCLKLTGLAGMLLALATLLNWNKYACAVFIFAIGFFGAGIQVSVYALLQRLVPDYLRGRIFGVNDLCSMAGLLAATGLLAIPQWPNIDKHITWIMAVTAFALGACGVWATSLRLKRGRFGKTVTFWRNLNDFYCRFMARAERAGPCTVPATGPVIIAANHNSVLDPFLLTAECRNRSIGFMIAKEYADLPLFGRLVDAIECVPVTRSGNDTGSVKAVLRHLHSGKSIGIFPAGRIQPRDERPDTREGVGMLALRSGAIVIPAYIDGLKPPLDWRGGRVVDLLSMIAPFFQRHRARVRFGPPVDLSRWQGREKDRDAYREASEHIMQRILELRQEVAE